MLQIGPFFYIKGNLISNACPLSEGREQAGKSDNSYGHDQLYDANFKTGDYIDYPRGRVIWDKAKEQAIGSENKQGYSYREKATEDELQKSKVRIETVSRMYKKLYEDNAVGRITDEWFMQLSHKYEVERMELKTKTTQLQQRSQYIRRIKGKKKSSAHHGLKSVMNTRYGPSDKT